MPLEETVLFSRRLPAEPDGLGPIDAEHANRDPADRRQPPQPRASPREMILPPVTAGVEERRELPGLLIDARYVWSFIAIAPWAGQAEVIEPRLAAVLLGDDVIDLEGQGIRRLGEPAVFADSLRPLPHAPIEPRLAHAMSLRRKSARLS